MPSSPVNESQGQTSQEDRSQEQPPEDGERQAQLEDELARMEDRYKRALADLDNYRKRSVRDVERRVQEAREAQLRDWLDVVDSIERALFMQPEGPVIEGLRAVLEQAQSVLARQGVERMGAVGDPFDPERHEAVGVRATDDVPDRAIAEVARSGYVLGDRVLRPAEVVVARADESDG
jgi:molecular chaperone GrpE